MFTNDDIKDLIKMGNSGEYKEINESTVKIINGLRNVRYSGITIVSNEKLNEGLPNEYTEIKIEVPKKSEIELDGEELSGMTLAKWYKNILKDFVRLIVTISNIATGTDMLEDLSEEEVDEIFSGLYKVKAKVKDIEWTKEMAEEAVKEFDESMKDAVRKVKEETEGFVEV